MGIFVWIGIGAFVGVLARLLLPEGDRASWLLHLLYGIAGGVVGGWIGDQIWRGGYITSLGFRPLVAAAVGAVVLVGIRRIIVLRQRRRAAAASQAKDRQRAA